MKRLSRSIGALVAMLAVAGAAVADPGLLVVGHGSPSPQWNARFMALVDEVKEAAEEAELGMPVEGALLEAEPMIPTVAAKLAAQGCDPIIVAPAFVVPTGHSCLDVPTVLGVQFSLAHTAAMKEEGLDVALGDSRIVILDPMVGWGGAMSEVLLERADELSKDPANESVLVLLHGSPSYATIIEHSLETSVTPALLDAGYRSVSYASVGLGKMMPHHGPGDDYDGPLTRDLAEKLEAAGGDGGAVVVIGAYVGLTPASLFTDWPEETADGAEVRVSAKSLLPHATWAEALVELADTAAEVLGLE